MQEENTHLKRCLVLQSFAPLFLLLTIKNFQPKVFYALILKFFAKVSAHDLNILSIALHHEMFGPMVVSSLGVVWIILTIITVLGFNGMQNSGFASTGEKIVINSEESDNSATFLVTYVLPLLTDDVTNLRNLISFLLMLSMVILLLIKSDSFYLNPILTLIRYKVFSFSFIETRQNDVSTDRVYIGITRKCDIDQSKKIQRKYISNGVFLIYNDIEI